MLYTQKLSLLNCICLKGTQFNLENRTNFTDCKIWKLGRTLLMTESRVSVSLNLSYPVRNQCLALNAFNPTHSIGIASLLWLYFLIHTILVTQMIL